LFAEIVQIPDLAFEKVHFYTIHVSGRQYSEYRDFQIRMQKHWKDRKQATEINRMIQKIGKSNGAEDRYFAREGYAERLPAPTYKFIDSDGETDYGLRLYCVRISDKIVILLNGERKSAQNPRDCPNCKPHFEFANKVSDSIYNAKLKDEIEFVDFDILMDEEFELNI